MFNKFLITAMMVVFMPLCAIAGVKSGDLPANVQWYFHADLQQLQKSDVGMTIYTFLEEEAFAEVREETGFDIGESIEAVTAYANVEEGVVVVVDGELAQDDKDKVMAIIALQSGESDAAFAPKAYKGANYYRISEHEESDHDHNGNGSLDTLDEEAFFCFDVKGKILLTSSAATMERLIDNKGRIKADKKSQGTLFVMTADRSFIQAGMQPGEFGEEADFDSNLIQNAKQLAVLVSDKAGQLSIETLLIATDPAMAESLGGIVRGLIGLAVLDDSMEPEVASIIRSTKVDVKDATLSVSMSFKPEDFERLVKQGI
jgi:hypothetical protein